MGSKSQTSTNQSSTTPTNLAGLQAIFNQVQGAASTPYTPYGGELTAGINGQQQTGINNVNSAAGAAQPYYGTAAGYATQAGAPISASQIQNYSNPYQQQVIDATMANINETNGQQQQQVKGNAALAGALGGDRQAVAQSELTRQQNLTNNSTLANLNSSNYTQALGAAQADRSAAGNAAGIYGNLGTAAQTAALQGAGAQINAGTLQQQTQQAQDTAGYQQYLQAQGFPYQQAQFFAQYGLPAAAAQGSSTSGTATTPGPNPFVQAAGLGLSAASLFSDERVKEDKEVIGKTFDGQPIYKFRYVGSPAMQIGLMAQDVEQKHPFAVGEHGGVKTVNYDDATEAAARKGRFANGGSVAGSPFSLLDAPGFIPKGQPIQMPSTAQSQGAQASSAPAQDQTSGLIKQMGGMKGIFAPSSTPDYGQTNNVDVGGYSMPQFGNSVGVGDYQMPTIGFNSGGLVEAIHAIHHGIRKSRGGTVGSTPLQGYADGGATFDDRFSGAFPMQAPVQEEEPFRLAGPEAMDAWRNGVDKPNPAVLADVPALPGPSAPSAPARSMNPMVQPSLPPQITNPDNAPEQPDAMPESALAYDSRGIAGRPVAPSSAAPEQPANSMGGFNPFNLSDKTRQALMVAGLGVAASKSPFALSAIGEGGLKGAGSYAEATQAERDAADKKISQQQNQTRIDQEAKRITQGAEQFAKTNSLAERRLQKDLDKTPAGYQATKDGKGYEPIPGGPADPEMIRKVTEAKTKPGAPIDDETADFVADQVLAGDSRALVGFGRGAQGAENLIKVRQLVAQKARAQGIDPTDILNNVAVQSGNTATQRTFGTQTAKMAINATEAQGAIELGRTASSAVPRTNWVPVNKAIQAYQTGTSDPALAKFGAANLAIINTYARAISPTGVPTVNDKQHAEHLLSTATGPAAYNAVLDQMNEEIKIAHGAPVKAKKELEDIRKGRVSEPAPATSGAVPVQPKTVPAGAAYSPSRKQWRAPDGTVYNADGSKV